MRYEILKKLSLGQFKRLTGVSKPTFEVMVSTLSASLNRAGKRGGQNKLSVPDQLLVTLEYWREYRTYFHIGQSWGIHESTVYRIVRKVETILLASQQFHLPSRQCVRQTPSLAVVVVDVTEIEIERPKKTTTVL
jgi:hypothetical protein